MEWANPEALGSAYGWAIGGGALLGAFIALFNSWRA